MKPRRRRVLFWNLLAAFLILIVLILGAWSIFYNDNNTFSPSRNVILGNHSIVTTTAMLGHFNRLEVQGNFIVTVVPGTTAHISLQTDSNILPFIEVGIMDGSLNIHVPNTLIVHPSQVPTIVLTAPLLNQIRLAGQTQLTALNVNTHDFTLSMSGKSTAIVAATVDNAAFNLGGYSTLNATITQGKSIALVNGGNSVITLSGGTDLLAITSGGKAFINAKHLSAKQVTLTASGNSVVSVNALESLDVTAAGKTEITYSGNPSMVTKTGFGDIKLFPLSE